VLKFVGLLALASGALAAAGAPSCSLVPGWTQQGPARSYDAENLFEYMDGNAEGYVLYGFDNMHGVSCEKGGVSLVIDISDFVDSDNAFGMFSANRDPRLPTANIGMQGQLVPRKAIFVKGQYYVEASANPEGDHTALLKEWVTALERSVEGSTKQPAALGWFPPGQQSLRLVPQSVLGIRLLKRGYVGQYDAGKAFVVKEESAQTATQVMEKLRARFRETTVQQIADDAFLTTDAYLGKVCIFRKGQYVGGYGNVPEGQDPVALAKALAARVQ
jgi:Family of unknown function (DUF6599)